MHIQGKHIRMIKVPSLVTSFVIPAASGLKNPHTLFPGKKVKRPDHAFGTLLWQGGIDYKVEGDLQCRLFQSEVEGNSDHHIMKSLNMLATLRSDNLALVLSYLGGPGSQLLHIPDGEDETNIIVGYAYIGGVCKVLYVEHEHGDEIHLHDKDLNRWGKKTPMVVVF